MLYIICKMFWKAENKIEPKNSFFLKIEKFYSELANDKVPKEFITELSEILTESQFKSYKNSWKKYPKSRKRYSEFDVKDLNHPFVHYQIMDFFRKLPNTSYVRFSCQLLNLSETEFAEFEKRKNQFENMF